MSTDLINIGDTSAMWPQMGTHSSYQIIVLNNGNTVTKYSYVFYDEISEEPPVDPKLVRQYNLARAKNNKNEMRRLEKLIANHKQGRYR